MCATTGRIPADEAPFCTFFHRRHPTSSGSLHRNYHHESGGPLVRTPRCDAVASNNHRPSRGCCFDLLLAWVLSRHAGVGVVA